MSANKWRCTMCGEKFKTIELIDFTNMHEDFLHLGDPAESNEIICPDCIERWNEMDENEKFDYLMSKEDKHENKN